jgi:hypothetical protein
MPFTGTGTPPAAPVLVEEAQKADLDTEAAAMVLKNLQDRLQGDHELELSLSWRIQRRSTLP